MYAVHVFISLFIRQSISLFIVVTCCYIHEEEDETLNDLCRNRLF